MSALDAKKAHLKPLIGVFILVVAVVIILFSGMSGITEANVGQHLQDVADYVAQEAGAVGKEAKLTHGKLAIEGWGFNKHATVDDVSLELVDKSSPIPVKWSVSTAKMLVLPDPVSANGLIFEFPGPINVAQGGQPKTVISFPMPLKYVYSNMQGSHGPIIVHALHLPNEMTFAAVGDGNGRIVVDHDPNSLFYEKFMPANHERESAYKFSHVKITSADGMQLAASEITSNFNEAKQENGRVEGKYALTVSDFVLHDHDKASKSYNLSVSLSTGRAPTGNTDTAINEALFTADTFKVKVTGGISTSSDDGFPSGNAMVDIDNVPHFLASELIPEQARKTVAAALEKVTGQPADKLTHAMIPLKRDKNGSLYIGDAMFAALAASVLADMVQTSAPAAGGSEPSSAPAAVAPSPGGSAPASKGDAGQPEKPAKSPM